MDFVHLHLHTEYSLLDGACRIDKLMNHLAEIGQTSVAITDHGVMYGAIDFYKAAKKAGIKPIIGSELYVAPRSRFDKMYELDSSAYHLVLLCKNEIGYKNLIYLCSMGFIEGFYIKPRVDFELIAQYSEGIICLSACLAGEVQQLLLNDNYEGAKACALKYLEVFGEGNYYLEIQDHGIEEQGRINPMLIRLSKETGIPLVATNDAHYIKRTDSELHDILLCIQTGKLVEDTDRMKFTGHEFYVKSGDEMLQLFPYAPQAIENTVKIAEKCNFDYDFTQNHLPKFPLLPGQDAYVLLHEKCMEGLKHRYGAGYVDVLERLEYELGVIRQMGFVDYFLIVGDFIAYAKEQKIPVGPGRGSAAGSIVAYCMGITQLDPIKYSLYFERFLNPERVSMPDIDIDFCYIRRQEVIDYVIQKYGADRVSQITTFGTMAARAAIRDVGRVLNMPYAEVDLVAKLVPQEVKITLDRALEISPELKAYYSDDARVKNLVDTARALEGMPRNASTHAAGIIITATPVYDYVPLARNELGTQTQYSMTTLEELGLLKMDFLGLRNLTILDDAVKLVNKRGGTIDLDNLDYEDNAVFDMLSQGKTSGVFQLESSGMTGVAMQMKPRSVEDITAIVALFRPGPMASIGTYIDRKNKPSHIKYKHPLLESILSVSYGCIVYQEQVMEIFQVLAGYSLGRADLVRRAMSKKKHDVLQSERQSFVFGNESEKIKGCIANGVPESIASDIFDEMLDFANYAFNKAHAAAYAVLAYQTAYLKYHYSKEYMAALLTSVLDSSEKVASYIAQCKEIGINVLPPDINESESDFTVSGNGIRFGIAAVKNVGKGFIAKLVEERTDGRFVSLDSFCQRMSAHDLNRRTLENLIKCGALDNLGARRSQLLSVFEGVLDGAVNRSKKNLSGQIDLFSTMEDEDDNIAQMPNIPELPSRQLLSMEKETTGLYLSGHPMDDMSKVIKKIKSINISRIVSGPENPEDDAVKDGQYVTVAGIIISAKIKQSKKGNNIAYITLEDLSGGIELMAFSNVIQRCSRYMAEDMAAIVYGRVSAREDEAPKIICEDVYPLTEESADLYEEYKKSRGGYHKTNTYKPKPRTLYLRIPYDNFPNFEAAKEVLRANNGECPVIVFNVETAKKMIARQDMWVEDTPQVIDELERILGRENVVMK